LLLNKRSSKVSDPGLWGVFGGTVDCGETPKKTVLRELNEEAGLPGGKPFGGGNTNGAHRVFPMLTYRNMDAGFVYYNFLVVVEKEFKPVLNWESEAAEWFTYGNWFSPLHPGVTALFNDKVSVDTIRHHLRR
jgi:8-oxo-dGTP pyrophosphatase MutT (NUDIX family)